MLCEKLQGSAEVLIFGKEFQLNVQGMLLNRLIWVFAIQQMKQLLTSSCRICCLAVP